MTNDEKFLEQFAGTARIFGLDGLKKLAGANVWIVGLGGVGSWAAEAIARSAVGKITLIDMDAVCASNINRQICATTGTLGRAKVDVLAERFREINPWAQISTRAEFVNRDSAGTLFSRERPDLLVDAIDGVVNKAALLAACLRERVPVVSSGGCAGKRDCTRVEIGDLAAAENDKLLQFVRKTLRREYKILPAGTPKIFGIPCVFSRERSVLLEENSVPEIISPAGGKPRAGTFASVTGTFGLALAQLAVERLLAGTRSNSVD